MSESNVLDQCLEDLCSTILSELSCTVDGKDVQSRTFHTLRRGVKFVQTNYLVLCVLS